MTTTIKIPANLRSSCDEQSSVEIENAVIVGDAIEHLVRKFPTLRDRLLDADARLLGHINLFLNATNVRDLQDMETPLTEDSELLLVTALAGG